MLKVIIIYIGVFCLGGGALFVLESFRKVSKIRDWLRRSDLFYNICQSRGFHHDEEDKKLAELLYYWGMAIIMLGVILNFIASKL